VAIWFTSDTHFGHTNIIRHCARPFADVDEMNARLLDGINDCVAPGDTLYHLGDFAFRGGDPALYCGRIRCRNVVLVLGNHDPQSLDGVPDPAFAALFRSVHSLFRLKVRSGGQDQLIVLCHYAFRVWDQVHRGSWHLYGHSHGTLPNDPNSRSWDAGVDANDYRPISLHQVASIMASKHFVPVDAHRERPAASGLDTHLEQGGSAPARPADSSLPPPLAPESR